MGALLTHGRALGNSGADHHGATVQPGDDPPGVPEGSRRPAAAATRQWRPLRGQEGTSDHTRRVLELAGLPQRHRGGLEL